MLWFRMVEVWGRYFKVSLNEQVFLGKTSSYWRNVTIFLYPKLIHTLKVPKRDKFLCEFSFASLIFDMFFI